MIVLSVCCRLVGVLLLWLVSCMMLSFSFMGGFGGSGLL